MSVTKQGVRDLNGPQRNGRVRRTPNNALERCAFHSPRRMYDEDMDEVYYICDRCGHQLEDGR